MSKTRTLHLHHAFLYISLPSLHDFHVRLPIFTFHGGLEQKTTTLFLSLIVRMNVVLNRTVVVDSD